MDHLWSPWRFGYVSRTGASDECVFCAKAAENRDAENFIVHRGASNFVVLNLYPYAAGHMMIVPYVHVATLEDTDEETAAEMMELTRAAARHLRSVYRPRGMNIGMNIGECAGAGIASHLHMHILPRWPGDVNFITTVGETRVIPEALEATYEKLRRAFRGD